MFELGMRLSFKKPTVIVVDNETKLPFDTSSIEHIVYPIDLHFSKIESFMSLVAAKIKSLLKSHSDGTYKPYLDTFGDFTIIEPEKKSIKFDEFVIKKLDEMSGQISAIRREQSLFREFTNPPNMQNRVLTLDRMLRETERIEGANRSIWSEESEYRLKEMWQAGFSASKIAELLGEGFTRNSVIGKAHRLGLEARPELDRS